MDYFDFAAVATTVTTAVASTIASTVATAVAASVTTAMAAVTPVMAVLPSATVVTTAVAAAIAGALADGRFFANRFTRGFALRLTTGMPLMAAMVSAATMTAASLGLGFKTKENDGQRRQTQGRTHEISLHRTSSKYFGTSNRQLCRVLRNC